ncbi:MAG: hypothetical protein FJ109_01005 [Deltaproteobacteria bacterium]|nr:hypothetical protein [Deltaproteobacteria bacterium]
MERFDLKAVQEAHLDKLRAATTAFLQGTLPTAHFRAVRVPAGIYEQRENGRYMVRIRCTAGLVTSGQLRTLSDAAERFGSPMLHLTTRQDIQIHDLLAQNLLPVVEMLAGVGLSSLGGGGNTVRNVTVCPMAGFCPQEEFDVTPHARMLTTALLSTGGNIDLPRKFKVALSGCEVDCAGARFNDVGFLPASAESDKRKADEAPSACRFRVFAGGGMGARSLPGFPLEESLPENEAVAATRAIREVFDRFGNRRNRHQARLRFLVERMGTDEFAAHYRRARSRSDGMPPPPGASPDWTRTEPVVGGAGLAPVTSGPEGTGPRIEPDSADLVRWMEQNVTPQRQAGYFFLTLPVFLGEIQAASLRAVADVAERVGTGVVRVVQTQNLLLPGVPAASLRLAHSLLRGAGLARPVPRVLREMTVCAGSSTCRLGICQSRGLATAVEARLESSRLSLDALSGVSIHISGCPNSCGRHPLADVGLAGAVRRVQGRATPHYEFRLGTGIPGTLAEPGPTLPARLVPEAVEKLLAGLADARAVLPASSPLSQKGLLEQFAGLQEVPDLHIDWGDRAEFSLAGRGPGECGAGVFDLIELDLATADEALGQGRLIDATVASARALLVTRGLSASSDLEALELFRTSLVGPDLLAVDHLPVVDLAVDTLRKTGAVPPPDREHVAALLAAVRELYGRLDASLRLPGPPASPLQEGPPAEQAQPPTPTRGSVANTPAPSPPPPTEDLRGVTCPLNFVKARMALARVPIGDELHVLLDAPGARNVPESLVKDGQQVLELAEEESWWRLRLRRLR